MLESPLELANIPAPIPGGLLPITMAPPIQPFSFIEIAEVRPINTKTMAESLLKLPLVSASLIPSFHPMPVPFRINPLPFIFSTPVVVVNPTAATLSPPELALVDVTVVIRPDGEPGPAISADPSRESSDGEQKWWESRRERESTEAGEEAAKEQNKPGGEGEDREKMNGERVAINGVGGGEQEIERGEEEEEAEQAKVEAECGEQSGGCRSGGQKAATVTCGWRHCEAFNGDAREERLHFGFESETLRGFWMIGRSSKKIEVGGENEYDFFCYCGDYS